MGETDPSANARRVLHERRRFLGQVRLRGDREEGVRCHAIRLPRLMREKLPLLRRMLLLEGHVVAVLQLLHHIENRLVAGTFCRWFRQWDEAW